VLGLGSYAALLSEIVLGQSVLHQLVVLILPLSVFLKATGSG